MSNRQRKYSEPAICGNPDRPERPLDRQERVEFKALPLVVYFSQPAETPARFRLLLLTGPATNILSDINSLTQY